MTDLQSDPIGALVDVILARQEPWRAHAACIGLPTGWWVPQRGDSTTRGKAVCATCPVRTECLEANITTTHGTFGGLTRVERRRLRAQLSLCADCGQPSGKRPGGRRLCDECASARRRTSRTRYLAKRKAAS